MSFNALKFCQDYNIDYSKGGKHYRPGWVNIVCQMGCSGHSGYHGGFNIQKGYYNCHRCGFSSLSKTIQKLTGQNYQTVKEILKKYSSVDKAFQDKKIVRKNKIRLPDHEPLSQKARRYLAGRKFDADKLARLWGISSTKHVGLYKNRILAPIYQNNRLVSYQSRDITGNHPQKYLACKQEDEVIPHQNCVYGLDQAASHSRKCLITEGITDVWRMGIGCIGVFGISFTKQQANLISKNFDLAFIFFDSEIQAQQRAEELSYILTGGFSNKMEVEILSFIKKETDPGDLPQNIADEIMKELNI